MENENLNNQPQNNLGVSFPTVTNEPPKKSGMVKTLLIAGILILVGILGFVIFKSASSKSDTISIESNNEDTLTTPKVDSTNSPSPSPTTGSTSTPKASSRSSLTIDVQNGTGITGEAAYLQNLLKDLGYTKVSVGNATSQDAVITTITYSKSVTSDISDEITKKLQSVYQEVSTKTSTSQLTDVTIVTGVRKGSTAKPSATPTSKSTSSPKATPKASATPTP